MTRRDDPLGRRALFGPAAGAGGDADAADAAGAAGGPAGAGGRWALYSAAPPPADARPSAADARGADAARSTPTAAGRRADTGRPAGTGRPGTGRPGVQLTCDRCRQRRPVIAATLAPLLASLWWPLRPAARFMRCPACHRWAWCRLSLGRSDRPGAR